MPSSAPTRPHHPTPTLSPYTTLFRSFVACRRSCYRNRKLNRERIKLGQNTVRRMAEGNTRFRRGVRGAVRPQLAYHDLTGLDLTGLEDRKSTRLNSSHRCISYAVFCSNAPAPSHTHTLSLHDALPIFRRVPSIVLQE